jgi:hypothetical protein
MDATKVVPGLKVADTLRDGVAGVVIATDSAPVEGIKSPQGPLITIQYEGGRQQKIRHVFADTIIVPD